MSTTVQLNVRMNQTLRDSGNATLQSRGISPSEFVRAVWEKLAQRGQPLEDLMAIVFEKPENPPHDAALPSPIDQGQALYDSLLHQLNMEGSSHANAFVNRTYDQMMEDALLERWQQKDPADE